MFYNLIEKEDYSMICFLSPAPRGSSPSTLNVTIIQHSLSFQESQEISDVTLIQHGPLFKFNCSYRKGVARAAQTPPPQSKCF